MFLFFLFVLFLVAVHQHSHRILRAVPVTVESAKARHRSHSCTFDENLQHVFDLPCDGLVREPDYRIDRNICATASGPRRKLDEQAPSHTVIRTLVFDRILPRADHFISCVNGSALCTGYNPFSSPWQPMYKNCLFGSLLANPR
jgi:hypothetical protein